MEKYCEVCGRDYSEEHHIIFRSQAGYLTNAKFNKIRLCYEHHRGNRSPHKDKKIDLELKKRLQAKLNKILYKDYYSQNDLKIELEISESVVEGIVKTIPLHKEGYKKEDILRRCMGGRLY